jgi:hypothetical protein
MQTTLISLVEGRKHGDIVHVAGGYYVATTGRIVHIAEGNYRYSVFPGDFTMTPTEESPNV